MKFLLAMIFALLCACSQDREETGSIADDRMKSHQSRARFEELLSGDADSVTPEEIVSTMLKFYRDVRAEDCRVDDGGDMLLYQWGTYDWGRGRWFEVNITRQFIPSGGDDEDIYQLSVTARYSPSPELDEFQSGSKWCRSPAGLSEFEAYIGASKPMQFIGERAAKEIEVEYGSAG